MDLFLDSICSAVEEYQPTRQATYANPCKVYTTPAWHDMARHGTTWHDMAQYGTAWQTRHSMAQHGTARHDTARHGTARH